MTEKKQVVNYYFSPMKGVKIFITETEMYYILQMPCLLYSVKKKSTNNEITNAWNALD